jgi:RNA polymerase sigma factor (sigma-70 family)
LQKPLRQFCVHLGVERLEDRTMPAAPVLLHSAPPQGTEEYTVVVRAADMTAPGVAEGLDAMYQDIVARDTWPSGNPTPGSGVAITPPGSGGGSRPVVFNAVVSADFGSATSTHTGGAAAGQPAFVLHSPANPAPSAATVAAAAPTPVTQATSSPAPTTPVTPVGTANFRIDATTVQAQLEAPTGPATRSGPATDASDGLLLQRYFAQRDQSAFAELVLRHRPFVQGVAQRVLGDAHAAEDAVQGTFLILARKAGLLDRHTPLTGWLYRVAFRLALRLRAVAARKRRWERADARGRRGVVVSEPAADLERQELRRVLSEELQLLPEKFRTPLILCYLDGLTHAQAARAIGLPRGSFAKRIGRALDALRDRLADRGLLR